MTRSTRAVLPLLASLAFLMSFGPASATADGPDYYRVVGVAPYDVLNMRVGPAASYRIVHTIPPQGRGIENVGGCVGSWCQVRYQGVVGWVHSGYLAEDYYDNGDQRVYRGVGVAYNDVLNVRSGPSTQYGIVGVIPHDGVDVITLGNCNGNWCRIRHDDTVGWVNNKFLAPY